MNQGELSHDSSMVSAIINAQNLGIDSEAVLNGRLGLNTTKVERGSNPVDNQL